MGMRRILPPVFPVVVNVNGTERFNQEVGEATEIDLTESQNVTVRGFVNGNQVASQSESITSDRTFDVDVSANVETLTLTQSGSGSRTVHTQSVGGTPNTYQDYAAEWGTQTLDWEINMEVTGSSGTDRYIRLFRNGNLVEEIDQSGFGNTGNYSESGSFSVGESTTIEVEVFNDGNAIIDWGTTMVVTPGLSTFGSVN